MEIQKWEYKSHPSKRFRDGTLPDHMYNKLGAEGWELVNVIQDGDSGWDFTLIFKRPAQLPSDIVFTSDLKKKPEDQVPGGNA